MARSISVPFRFDASGRVATTTLITTIVEQQIVNVLVTGKFERTMRPLYGANLQSMLFEPVNSAVLADLQTEVAQRINEVLRGAEVRSVRFREDVGNPMSGESTRSQVLCEVGYFIPPADQTLSFVQVPFSSFITEETTF